MNEGVELENASFVEMSDQALDQTEGHDVIHLLGLKGYFAKSAVHLNSFGLEFFFCCQFRGYSCWLLDELSIVVDSEILACKEVKFIFPISHKYSSNRTQSKPICFLYKMN